MDEQSERLQAQISQLSERVTGEQCELRALARRVERLEADAGRCGEMLLSLQRQGDAIEGIRARADDLDEDLSGVSGRVSVIEKEPAERWKKIGFELIKYIVLAIVGAVIGYLMK